MPNEDMLHSRQGSHKALSAAHVSDEERQLHSEPWPGVIQMHEVDMLVVVGSRDQMLERYTMRVVRFAESKASWSPGNDEVRHQVNVTDTVAIVDARIIAHRPGPGGRLRWPAGRRPAFPSGGWPRSHGLRRAA